MKVTPVWKIREWGTAVHNAIHQARKSIKGFDKGVDFSLCGGCAIGALFLRNKINDNNDIARFVMGTYAPKGWEALDLTHCWVEWRGQIVDPTASQFGYEKPVLLGYRSQFPEYIKEFGLKEASKCLIKWKSACPFKYECIWHSDTNAEIIRKS